MLYQLQQHPAGRRRVNERDETVVRADARRFVNQPRAAALSAAPARANIVNAHGYVMNAGAALLKKPGNGRIVGRRLKQLNARLADGQHRHAHPLLLDHFRVHQLQPQRIAPEPKRLVDASASQCLYVQSS